LYVSEVIPNVSSQAIRDTFPSSLLEFFVVIDEEIVEGFDHGGPFF
jgi:hypothetical protein